MSSAADTGRPDALHAARGYSVADLCRRWRVGPDKVRGFLKRGELVAVNVASDLGGKPQWRVMAESVERFEARRTSAPRPKPACRKRHAVRDYYPEL
jgi:hypothetical protein